MYEKYSITRLTAITKRAIESKIQLELYFVALIRLITIIAAPKWRAMEKIRAYCVSIAVIFDVKIQKCQTHKFDKFINIV